VSETVAFDWGFTGHYHHEKSGLHLAPFRAYDADLGRWLSRDPLGEAGGINLYEYALSNPVNFVDPLGLNAASFTAGFVDSFTWGLGSYAMSGLGVDGINRCSTAYLLGGLSGFGLQIAAGAGGLVVARALMKGGFKKLLAKFLTKKGPPRSSTIKANKAAGDAWEANVVQSQLPRTQTGIETQITIRSAGPSGKKVRLDAVGKDAAGKIRLTDAKASPDAGFTKNQKVAYPELVTHGGTVAGKGKGAYPGGTVIPPTAVDVIRKVP
jgi:RHS repeat-associated protein